MVDRDRYIVNKDEYRDCPPGRAMVWVHLADWLACYSQYCFLPPQETVSLTIAEFCCGPLNHQIWHLDAPQFRSDNVRPALFHPTAPVRNQFARCHCYSNDVVCLPLVTDIAVEGVA